MSETKINETITTLDVTAEEFRQSKKKFLEVKAGDKVLFTLEWQKSLTMYGKDQWWLMSPGGFKAMGVTHSDAVLKALEYLKYMPKKDSSDDQTI